MLQPIAVLLLLVPLILLSNAQHPTLNSFTKCPPSSPDEGQLFWDSNGNPLLAAQQMSLMMKPNSNKPQFDITPSVLQQTITTYRNKIANRMCGTMLVPLTWDQATGTNADCTVTPGQPSPCITVQVIKYPADCTGDTKAKYPNCQYPPTGYNQPPPAGQIGRTQIIIVSDPLASIYNSQGMLIDQLAPWSAYADVYVLPFRGSAFVDIKTSPPITVVNCSDQIASDPNDIDFDITGCISAVSKTLGPNWLYGFQTFHAAADALFLINQIQGPLVCTWPVFNGRCMFPTFVYAESLGTRTANMMQLIHHSLNVDQCIGGQDEVTYCNGIYGLGNATGLTYPPNDPKGVPTFSTHIDGFIMDSVFSADDTASRWILSQDAAAHDVLSGCRGGPCGFSSYGNRDDTYPVGAYQAVLDMIKLSSESYCIEAHKVGANTSALKFFIETYASSRGGWKGPLTWMATAFYPAINAMAYRYIRCAPEDIAWFAALVAPASHVPNLYDKTWSDPYKNISFLPFVNMMRNEAWPADSLLDYYDTFIRTKIQDTPFKFQFDYPFTVLMAKWPRVNPLGLQRQAPPTAYYMQNVLATSGSASPIMTESSFARFSSQVASNQNYQKVNPGEATPSFKIFPVMVQGAGEHVFFLASDCMASFVDPNSASANVVPNPTQCATQAPLAWQLPSSGRCTNGLRTTIPCWPNKDFYTNWVLSPQWTCDPGNQDVDCLTGACISSNCANVASLPAAYTNSGVSALFQQYINAKTNAYFVQDLSNQVSNFTQLPSYELKTAVEASAVGLVLAFVLFAGTALKLRQLWLERDKLLI